MLHVEWLGYHKLVLVINIGLIGYLYREWRPRTAERERTSESMSESKSVEQPLIEVKSSNNNLRDSVRMKPQAIASNTQTIDSIELCKQKQIVTENRHLFEIVY